MKALKKYVQLLLFSVLSITLVFYNFLEGKKLKGISLEEVLSIGSLEDDTLYMWVGITTDSTGHIYVTDAMDYSIKKFDAKGALIKKSGRKGQGPGEFLAPRLIEYHKGLIYVTDEKIPGIHVFDEDLNYKYHIILNLPINDLCITRDDKICVLSGFAASPEGLVIVNPKGNNKVDLKNPMDGEGFWSNWKKFKIDSAGSFYFVSTFEDKIEKRDGQMKEVWSRSLLGKKKAKFKKRTNFGPSEIPTEVLYKDIALDVYGNLFVLGGHVSQNRSRDIYVLDNQGNHLLTLTLPELSHCIHIDSENCLYSRAGMATIIKKYKLKYAY
ncbi:MAG: hypothetical protein QHH14_13860 [Clostridiales bacterium]|nr:hypothetical protein [Clostridiales bacterium]